MVIYGFNISILKFLRDRIQWEKLSKKIIIKKKEVKNQKLNIVKSSIEIDDDFSGIEIDDDSSGIEIDDDSFEDKIENVNLKSSCVYVEDCDCFLDVKTNVTMKCGCVWCFNHFFINTCEFGLGKNKCPKHGDVRVGMKHS